MGLGGARDLHQNLIWFLTSEVCLCNRFHFSCFLLAQVWVLDKRLSVLPRFILVKSGSDDDASKLNLTVFFIESVLELLRMIVRWLVVGDKGWSGFENISFHHVTKSWSNDGRAKASSNLGNVAADMAVGSERGSKDGDAVLVLRCTDCRWDSWEGGKGLEARRREVGTATLTARRQRVFGVGVGPRRVGVSDLLHIWWAHVTKVRSNHCIKFEMIRWTFQNWMMIPCSGKVTALQYIL